MEVEEERGARRGGGGGHSHTSLITGTGAPQHHRNGGRRKVFSFLPLQLFPSVGTNKRCCKREEALGESGRRRDRERRRCACLDFFLLLLPAFLLRPLPSLACRSERRYLIHPLPPSKKQKVLEERKWNSRGNGEGKNEDYTTVLFLTACFFSAQAGGRGASEKLQQQNNGGEEEGKACFSPLPPSLREFF